MSIRIGTAGLAGLLLLASLSCGAPTDGTVPSEVCGTRVDPDLTRPLVKPGTGWHEYNKVDRSEAVTAPCLVFSGSEAVLSLRFSWRPVATDLMYLATDTGTVSGVTDPHSIASPYKTIVGTDGAISTAPCKTKGGNYFTLTLQLPRIQLLDRTHRKDIEKFMRAYFPATVKTLGCRATPP